MTCFKRRLCLREDENPEKFPASNLLLEPVWQFEKSCCNAA
jgi:hypothetical protein